LNIKSELNIMAASITPQFGGFVMSETTSKERLSSAAQSSSVRSSLSESSKTIRKPKATRSAGSSETATTKASKTVKASESVATSSPAPSAKTKDSLPTIDGTTRHRLIQELAYRQAEQRNFCGGDELGDWLAAEQQIDQLYKKAN
jgi:hypothetical protein